MGANRWLQTFGQCHLSAAYSPSAFEITILRTVPSDQRNVAEIAAIAEYGTYASPEHYNLTPGGGQRPTWDPLSTLREYGHTNKPALLVSVSLMMAAGMGIGSLTQQEALATVSLQASLQWRRSWPWLKIVQQHVSHRDSTTFSKAERLPQS
ncbi:TPA: hypothetical protein ACH3X2_009562 [Trebouxia sp. C0005]